MNINFKKLIKSAVIEKLCDVLHYSEIVATHREAVIITCYVKNILNL